MFEDIYDLFKVEMDGEEFDSDDDALLAAKNALKRIFAKRDWKKLKKTQTLAVGSFDLSAITDLDHVLKIWYNGYELKRADYDNRYDTEYDYYIDEANNLIVPINGGLDLQALIVDYKSKPADLTDSNTPVVWPEVYPAVVFDMGMTYYRKDQDLSVYNQMQERYEEEMNLLIDSNEN